MLTLIFFGPLGELSAGETLQFSIDAPITALQLLQLLKADYSDVVQAVKDTLVTVAINKTKGDWSSMIHNGDEVAFLPPVSGG